MTDSFRRFRCSTVIYDMSYRKSAVYQKAFSLVVEVEQICKALPRHELFCLGSQLRRASRSIGANYVEGYVRQGIRVDQRRFLVYSQGSCDETKYWLEVARAIGLVEEERFATSFDHCEQISKMLVSVLRKMT